MRRKYSSDDILIQIQSKCQIDYLVCKARIAQCYGTC